MFSIVWASYGCIISDTPFGDTPVQSWLCAGPIHQPIGNRGHNFQACRMNGIRNSIMQQTIPYFGSVSADSCPVQGQSGVAAFSLVAIDWANSQVERAHQERGQG